MIKNMGRVYTNGVMEKSMMVGGRMENNMEKLILQIR